MLSVVSVGVAPEPVSFEFVASDLEVDVHHLVDEGAPHFFPVRVAGVGGVVGEDQVGVEDDLAGIGAWVGFLVGEGTPSPLVKAPAVLEDLLLLG